MVDHLFYVASPYSTGTTLSREEAFLAVVDVVAELMRNNIRCISPIAHNHLIAERHELPRGWDFWGAHDKRLLQACTALLLVKIDGYDRSEGVAAETQMARDLGLPIFSCDPSKPLDITRVQDGIAIQEETPRVLTRLVETLDRFDRASQTNGANEDEAWEAVCAQVHRARRLMLRRQRAAS